MANNTPALSKKKIELKKNQAITVMVIGAILVAQAFFFSTEGVLPLIRPRWLLP